MLDGIRTCVHQETIPGERQDEREDEARRDADRPRYDTPCAVVWNSEGRPEPLEDFSARLLAGA